MQDDPFQAVRRPAAATLIGGRSHILRDRVQVPRALRGETTVRRRLITMARMSFGLVMRAIRLRMTHLDTSIIAQGRGVGMHFRLVFRSVGHTASRRDMKEETFKMKDYWPW
ncbi:hypothetical protein SY26_18595 [Paracoccus sp. 228]|nr:hypothetical protein SY26_18595 [Paracoccus sp. 228]